MVRAVCIATLLSMGRRPACHCPCVNNFSQDVSAVGNLCFVEFIHVCGIRFQGVIRKTKYQIVCCDKCLGSPE